MLRSHTCGELRLDHVDSEATLCGWVDGYRDHGGGIFIDLRDRYGLTQVCFGPPDSSNELIERAKKLRAEDVIRVTGFDGIPVEGGEGTMDNTGTELFPVYEMTVDLPKSEHNLAIDVPGGG